MFNCGTVPSRSEISRASIWRIDHLYYSSIFEGFTEFLQPYWLSDSPNTRSTTLALTGTGMLHHLTLGLQDFSRTVGAEGLEPPELKHLIYSQARYQLRYTLPYAPTILFYNCSRESNNLYLNGRGVALVLGAAML